MGCQKAALRGRKGQGRRGENNRVRDTWVLIALGAVKQGMSDQLRDILVLVDELLNKVVNLKQFE